LLLYPELTSSPKLMILDIKGEANVVHEPGELYPHHNLYYITSSTWDLRALQMILRSGIARLFVGNYTTKMRGGYFRFQAQYLRKICLPHWDDVPLRLRQELIDTCSVSNPEASNELACRVYGIGMEERVELGWVKDFVNAD
jgi:hypothetical protein